MIVAGQPILASDFVAITTGATDASKAIKTDALGMMSLSFINKGSTGADGALNISSGTTNYNLGGAAIFIKNFTSISITGTAKVTFTNPHTNGTLIIFKHQTGFTCTSSTVPAIDVSSLGGSANNFGTTNARKNMPGASASGTVGGPGGLGNLFANQQYDHIIFGCGAGGTNGSQTPFGGNNPGGPGGASSLTDDGSPGSNGTSTSGNSASPTGGIGGMGGGGLLIIGGGAINFTSTIWAKGSDGGNPNFNGGGNVGASAGSAGAGGYVTIIGDSISTNTGTIVVTAGAPGVSGTNCGSPGASANGSSFIGIRSNVGI